MSSMTVAEYMLYSTTKLTSYRGGAVSGTGTGFFYNVPLGPDEVAFLMVTNKHVVEGASEIAITFHVSAPPPAEGPSGQVVTWKFDVRSRGSGRQFLVIPHPRDDIDLCAINLSSELARASQKGFRFFASPLAREYLPGPEEWQNFDAIEEVTMIGCPRGIYDASHNIPIVRRGISATPLLKDYNGKPEFMVDMACFPGSSGSPIFVYNRDGYFDRRTRKFLSGRQRLHLVGILYAGPLIRSDGQVVATGSPRVEVATAMHLGYAIRSTQILAIENELIRGRSAKGLAVPPPQGAD